MAGRRRSYVGGVAVTLPPLRERRSSVSEAREKRKAALAQAARRRSAKRASLTALPQHESAPPRHAPLPAQHELAPPQHHPSHPPHEIVSSRADGAGPGAAAARARAPQRPEDDVAVAVRETPRGRRAPGEERGALTAQVAASDRPHEAARHGTGGPVAASAARVKGVFSDVLRSELSAAPAVGKAARDSGVEGRGDDREATTGGAHLEHGNGGAAYTSSVAGGAAQGKLPERAAQRTPRTRRGSTRRVVPRVAAAEAPDKANSERKSAAERGKHDSHVVIPVNVAALRRFASKQAPRATAAEVFGAADAAWLNRADTASKINLKRERQRALERQPSKLEVAYARTAGVRASAAVAAGLTKTRAQRVQRKLRRVGTRYTFDDVETLPGYRNASTDAHRDEPGGNLSAELATLLGDSMVRVRNPALLMNDAEAAAARDEHRAEHHTAVNADGDSRSDIVGARPAQRSPQSVDVATALRKATDATASLGHAEDGDEGRREAKLDESEANSSGSGHMPAAATRPEGDQPVRLAIVEPGQSSDEGDVAQTETDDDLSTVLDDEEEEAYNKALSDAARPKRFIPCADFADPEKGTSGKYAGQVCVITEEVEVILPRQVPPEKEELPTGVGATSRSPLESIGVEPTVDDDVAVGDGLPGTRDADEASAGTVVDTTAEQALSESQAQASGGSIEESDIRSRITVGEISTTDEFAAAQTDVVTRAAVEPRANGDSSTAGSDGDADGTGEGSVKSSPKAHALLDKASGRGSERHTTDGSVESVVGEGSDDVDGSRADGDESAHDGSRSMSVETKDGQSAGEHEPGPGSMHGDTEGGEGGLSARSNGSGSSTTGDAATGTDGKETPHRDAPPDSEDDEEAMEELAAHKARAIRKALREAREARIAARPPVQQRMHTALSMVGSSARNLIAQARHMKEAKRARALAEEQARLADVAARTIKVTRRRWVPHGFGSLRSVEAGWQFSGRFERGVARAGTFYFSTGETLLVEDAGRTVVVGQMNLAGVSRDAVNMSTLLSLLSVCNGFVQLSSLAWYLWRGDAVRSAIMGTFYCLSCAYGHHRVVLVGAGRNGLLLWIAQTGIAREAYLVGWKKRIDGAVVDLAGKVQPRRGVDTVVFLSILYGAAVGSAGSFVHTTAWADEFVADDAVTGTVVFIAVAWLLAIACLSLSCTLSDVNRYNVHELTRRTVTFGEGWFWGFFAIRATEFVGRLFVLFIAWSIMTPVWLGSFFGFSGFLVWLYGSPWLPVLFAQPRQLCATCNMRASVFAVLRWCFAMIAFPGLEETSPSWMAPSLRFSDTAFVAQRWLEGGMVMMYATYVVETADPVRNVLYAGCGVLGIWGVLLTLFGLVKQSVNRPVHAPKPEPLARVESVRGSTFHPAADADADQDSRKMPPGVAQEDDAVSRDHSAIALGDADDPSLPTAVDYRILRSGGVNRLLNAALLNDTRALQAAALEALSGVSQLRGYEHSVAINGGVNVMAGCMQYVTDDGMAIRDALHAVANILQSNDRSRILVVETGGLVCLSAASDGRPRDLKVHALCLDVVRIAFRDNAGAAFHAKLMESAGPLIQAAMQRFTNDENLQIRVVKLLRRLWEHDGTAELLVAQSCGVFPGLLDVMRSQMARSSIIAASCDTIELIALDPDVCALLASHGAIEVLALVMAVHDDVAAVVRSAMMAITGLCAGSSNHGTVKIISDTPGAIRGLMTAVSTFAGEVQVMLAATNTVAGVAHTSSGRTALVECGVHVLVANCLPTLMKHQAFVESALKATHQLCRNGQFRAWTTGSGCRGLLIVVDAMRHYSHEVDIQVLGIAIIDSVARRSELRARLNGHRDAAETVLEALLMVMNRHRDHLPLQTASARLLVTLANGVSENQQALLRMKCVPNLCVSMDQHALNPSIMLPAMRVLSVLCQLTKAAERAVREGAAFAIALAMEKQAEHVVIQEIGCEAFARLLKHRRLRGEVLAKPICGLERIVNAMRRHTSEAAVQQHAASALRPLVMMTCKEDQLVRSQLSELLRAMEAHVDNAPCIKEVLSTVLTLLVACGESIAAHLCERNGLGLTCKALKLHMDHEAVCNVAVKTISMLATPESKRTAASKSARYMLRAMRAHGQDVQIQEYGCRFIRLMTQQRKLRDAIMKPRLHMLSTLVAVIRLHYRNSGVTAEGIGALGNIAEARHNRSAVAEAGGVDAVFRALKMFPRHESINFDCIWILRFLCETDDDRRNAFLADGGVSVLGNIFRALLRKDATVVTEASKLMRLIGRISPPDFREEIFAQGGTFAVNAAMGVDVKEWDL